MTKKQKRAIIKRLNKIYVDMVSVQYYMQEMEEATEINGMAINILEIAEHLEGSLK